MKIEFGDFEFTECWDGVLYKKLSCYPEITDWEIQTVLDFIKYEKANGRECELVGDENILAKVRAAIADDNRAKVAVPEKITEYKVVNERSDIKSMELYTKCKYPDWDRIVHIKVARADNMSELVADDSVLKLIIVNEGRMTVELLGVKKVVSSPSLICLSDEKVIFSEASDLNLTIVYFRSTEIRDEFSMERIQSGEFEKEMGRIIFQDYLLLTEFISKENANDKIIPINFSAYLKVAKLVENINYNLVEQVDGFWPCRSRSFLMELLYSIKYMRAEDGKVVIEEKNDSDIVGEIIQYMNEHISEKISLQDILKKYSTNRNHLNNIFIQETSMTCLSYLEKMRINLAKIMLSDTELLSAEIAARVGYSDPNYFIKVFKKHTKETPTKYREKNK